MIHALFDTCVWLNLATNFKERDIANALKSATERMEIEFVVPDVVREEFDRRIVSTRDEKLRNFHGVWKQLKNQAKLHLEDTTRTKLEELMDEISASSTALPAALDEQIALVDGLLKGGKHTVTTDSMKLKVYDIGYAKLAPIHRKNGIADAALFEHFRSLNPSQDDKKAFVTDNKEDFSDTDARLPHGDLAGAFNGIRSFYCLGLANFVDQLAPGLLNENQKTALRTTSLNVCPDGHQHVFDEERGAFMRSQYGGLTWQLICQRCGAPFDTGDYYE